MLLVVCAAANNLFGALGKGVEVGPYQPWVEPAPVKVVGS
jgi:hypothetical protein